MKIKLLLTGLIFLNFGPIFSQYSIQNSMEKYWSLRKRLRDSFIVVSPIVDQNGTNLPAEMYCFDEGQKGPHWGEDILGSQYTYYLAMLATEYKLLKQTGKDYKVTLAELIYALFALERLDMFSEPYLFKFDPIWKKERPTLLSYFKTHPENGYTAEQSATNSFFTKWLNGDYFNLRYGMDDVFLNSSENYWNGFLLRDDINERFYENYGEKFGLLANLNFKNIEQNTSYGFHSEGLGLFNNTNREPNPEKYLEASQDNLGGLLLGLSLVAKLLDKETISTEDLPLEFENGFMVSPSYAGSVPKFSIINKFISLGIMAKVGDSFVFDLKKWSENITNRFFNQYYHPNGSVGEVRCDASWLAKWLGACSPAMIDYMKKAKWGLWNPVTGDYVWKGSGITNKGDMDNFSADLLYGYGFYKAAENILNMGLSVDFMQGKESAEYTYTNFFRCVNMQNSIDSMYTLFAAIMGGPMQDMYRVRLLGAIGNVDKDKTFDDLLVQMDRFGISHYEHLPLVYLLLHGDKYLSITKKDYICTEFDYFDVLNKATIYPQSTGVRDYQSMNRLFDPEKSRYYHNYSCNGIDYMLLNNLVLLTMDNLLGSNSSLIDINDTDYREKLVFYGNNLQIDKTPTHNLPIRVYSNNSIRLMPGTRLKASNGSDYLAKVIDLSATVLKREVQLPFNMNSVVFKSNKMSSENAIILPKIQTTG